ncbi:MAG: hypothetical protein ABFS39_03935 [Pseudomonadota bacterium]
MPTDTWAVASGRASHAVVGGVAGRGTGCSASGRTSATAGGVSGSSINHQTSRLSSSRPVPNSQTPGRCHSTRRLDRDSCKGAAPLALRSCSARSSASRMDDIASPHFSQGFGIFGQAGQAVCSIIRKSIAVAMV